MYCPKIQPNQFYKTWAYLVISNPKKRGYELRPGEPGDNVGNTTYFCCLSAHKLPATTPSISSGGNILLAFFLSSPITWLVFFTFVDVRTTWVYRPPHSGINDLQYKLISLQYSYSSVWIRPFQWFKNESSTSKKRNQNERHLPSDETMVHIFSISRPHVGLLGITPIWKPTKFIFILFAFRKKNIKPSVPWPWNSITGVTIMYTTVMKGKMYTCWWKSSKWCLDEKVNPPPWIIERMLLRWVAALACVNYATQTVHTL